MDSKDKRTIAVAIVIFIVLLAVNLRFVIDFATEHGIGLTLLFLFIILPVWTIVFVWFCNNCL